jgi:hypothetical protein
MAGARTGDEQEEEDVELTEAAAGVAALGL